MKENQTDNPPNDLRKPSTTTSTTTKQRKQNDKRPYIEKKDEMMKRVASFERGWDFKKDLPFGSSGCCGGNRSLILSFFPGFLSTAPHSVSSSPMLLIFFTVYYSYYYYSCVAVPPPPDSYPPPPLAALHRSLSYNRSVPL